MQTMATHQADIMALIRDILMQQLNDPRWVGRAGGQGRRAGQAGRGAPMPALMGIPAADSRARVPSKAIREDAAVDSRQ